MWCKLKSSILHARTNNLIENKKRTSIRIRIRIRIKKNSKQYHCSRFTKVKTIKRIHFQFEISSHSIFLRADIIFAPILVSVLKIRKTWKKKIFDKTPKTKTDLCECKFLLKQTKLPFSDHECLEKIIGLNLLFVLRKETANWILSERWMQHCNKPK